MTGLIGVLAPVAVLILFGWATPGPNHLAILSASVGGGRPAGMATALGICAATFVWLSLALGGVTALFELFPRFLLAFRIAGALFLFWLSYKALKYARSPDGTAPEVAPSRATGWKAFRTGFIVNATNPKAAIFFGSLLTAFVPPNAPWTLLAAVVVIATVMSIVLNLFAAYMYSTHTVVKGFQAARKPMSAVFSVLFGALGVAVIWDALKQFRST